MVQSVSCLQRILSRFPTTCMWQYDLELRSPTLKNDKYHPFIMMINCTDLYDPGAYGSFCILPTIFFYYVTVRPWPLTIDSENKKALSLIMLINFTKLSDPGANGSFCILPTISYYVTIRPWPLTMKNSRHHPLSCWSNVPRCKILIEANGSAYKARNGRRY